MFSIEGGGEGKKEERRKGGMVSENVFHLKFFTPPENTTKDAFGLQSPPRTVEMLGMTFCRSLPFLRQG